MSAVRHRVRRVPGARAMRRAALGAVDAVEATLGRRDPLRPPRRLQGVGSGDFAAVGATIVRQLVELGGLREDARVLDVGCGSGRVAVPLTRHLTTGSYDGFDIDARAIAWCRTAITPRFPAFRFAAIDVANGHYNPAGELDPADATFPYPDDAFDFVLATSLFTHLLPAALLNYAAEASRVLAPGGTFFGTFFLLDDEASGLLDRGAAALELPHRLRDPRTGIAYRATDERSPETAIALDEAVVLDALARAGLDVRATHPGVWAGRERGVSYQDIVVARRA
jgi:SAM-dependent methyltransferase